MVSGKGVIDMDLKDCKIGTRVALLGDSYPCKKGSIKSKPEAHKLDLVVIVEWNDGCLQKIYTKNLVTEAEGVAEDIRICKERERLENEWQKTEATVRLKMQEAADAVDEASRLTRKAGKDLSDMYDITSPLINAISDAGWSTSSWSC
jgi:hypothetical protein